MEKHTVWELKQKQSLSLDAKIQMTRLRLKQWHIKYEGNLRLSAISLPDFICWQQFLILEHCFEM